jgi:hypothetical protein
MNAGLAKKANPPEAGASVNYLLEVDGHTQ